MSRRLVIDPVTRIEGHARITIHVDDAGEVVEARFHVTEFRGFEKFCEGRSFLEMPVITARICGICPVSHLLASARAGDHLLAVHIPGPARLLRQLVNLAQLVQSHALSFFHLSSPDWVLGYDAGPFDGIYGERTAAAVSAFQTAAGLRADGKVGPQTWSLLKKALEPAPAQ